MLALKEVCYFMQKNLVMNNPLIPTGLGIVDNGINLNTADKISPDSARLYSIAENLAKKRENEVAMQTSTHVVDKSQRLKLLA